MLPPLDFGGFGGNWEIFDALETILLKILTRVTDGSQISASRPDSFVKFQRTVNILDCSVQISVLFTNDKVDLKPLQVVATAS